MLTESLRRSNHIRSRNSFQRGRPRSSRRSSQVSARMASGTRLVAESTGARRSCSKVFEYLRGTAEDDILPGPARRREAPVTRSSHVLPADRPKPCR